MEITLSVTTIDKKAIMRALIGSGFITFCSLVTIPIGPIPFTLQTFAIALLAIYLPPDLCCYSVVFYLIEASIGLPVLCGYSNPFWFLGNCAGYLMAFPVAGYLMSYFYRKSSSAISQFFSLLSGMLFILVFGSLVLSFYLPLKSALLWGFFLFIPSAILKTLVSMALNKGACSCA